jgi:hypothetical protein
VASGLTLRVAGRQWTFRTPRGKHTVIGSKVAPVWTPPDWAYAETAHEYNLALAWLSPGKPVTLRDGRTLMVRNGAVGLLDRNGVFRALPRDEHIVFDATLYVPPLGTINRRVKVSWARMRWTLATATCSTAEPPVIARGSRPHTAASD